MTGPRSSLTLFVAAAGALGAVAAPPAEAAQPDGYVARLTALALLERFNADLLEHDSATQTLQRWCDAHGLASGARVVAERVTGVDKPADAAIRGDLNASASEPVRYRRVRLSCGGRVLSEADNWYLPSRLTPEMNRQLEETNRPFGAVVAGLGFHRRTLSVKLLFHPLSDGWETRATPSPADNDPLVTPARVLEHRAVLSTSAGAPFSLVVETYTDAVLAPAPNR